MDFTENRSGRVRNDGTVAIHAQTELISRIELIDCDVFAIVGAGGTNQIIVDPLAVLATNVDEVNPGLGMFRGDT